MRFESRYLLVLLFSTVFARLTTAQSYTPSDAISVINRLGGFSLHKVTNESQWLWLITDYSATLDGTVVTVEETNSNLQENARTGETCRFNATVHTKYVFDIRDMQSTITLVPVNSPGAAQWPNDARINAVFSTKNSRKLVRVVVRQDPITCSTPADAYFQPSKNDSTGLVITFAGIDAANQLKSMVASAWQQSPRISAAKKTNE